MDGSIYGARILKNEFEDFCDTGVMPTFRSNTDTSPETSKECKGTVNLEPMKSNRNDTHQTHQLGYYLPFRVLPYKVQYNLQKYL